ncbi:hypothetical protein [Brevibacterium samyangense]|uniref:Uncharacterized protein n=1 Tax=Brevibacterium samyangense TaxID=366888 RepID=A0ABN2T479_9MICO
MSKGKGRNPASYKDVLWFGVGAAVLTFLVTTITMGVYRGHGSLVLCLLFTVIAFVAAAGVAGLLHLVSRRDDPEDVQFPVLK